VSHLFTTVPTVVTEVRRLAESTPEVVAQINRLIPQLKPAWDPVTVPGVARLLDSPTRVYVAVRDEVVVGLLLLVPHRHLPGVRFHVEDVVVDRGHRRQGIARALLETAMGDTPDDVLPFDLRSHRTRQAARALYLGLGFEPSDTTVFRYTRPH
jgi:ribosomal protein S18 acetylase RimI-like enzyme